MRSCGAGRTRAPPRRLATAACRSLGSLDESVLGHGGGLSVAVGGDGGCGGWLWWLAVAVAGK